MRSSDWSSDVCSSDRVTGLISYTLAARIDGVWVKRDGFLHDVNNDRDINNRDRYFLRGQLLFETTDALSVRLIADYTSREEEIGRESGRERVCKYVWISVVDG